MIFDTHCHLNDESLKKELSSLLESALKVGVNKILIPGYDLFSSKYASDVSVNSSNLYCSVGVHPDSISSLDDNIIDNLKNIAKSNLNVKAIGEIGLDYHYTSETNEKEKQKEAFIKQILLANELKLPIIVHCRDAIKDCLDILKQYRPIKGGVMHCYSGSVESMHEFINLGLYIAFGGTLTFKNSKTVKDVARAVPINRIVLETDAPYLTPVPFRGKINKPEYTILVLKELALLRNMDVLELEEIIYQNSLNLFHV